MSLAFALGLFCCAWGCGKGGAPTPPRARTQALLDLFAALDKGEHATALNKVFRLKEIDPTNVFLASLENTERNNAVIAGAQLRIERGDVDGALAALATAINQYGKQPALVEAQDELSTLKKINAALDVLAGTQDAVGITKAVVKMREAMKGYAPAQVFAPYMQEKLSYAFELERNEKSRAVFDLCSDITILRKDNPSGAAALYAVLALERPEHPDLKKYLRSISNPKTATNSGENR